MPITAAYEHNDARGTARLLAAIARDCVRDPSIAAQHEVAMNNVYRLLQAYRTQAFFGLEPAYQVSPDESIEALTLLPPVERHVKDVRDALEHALRTTFASEPQEHALDLIESVLRAVTYPENGGHVPPEKSQKVTRFFDSMLSSLQSA